MIYVLEVTSACPHHAVPLNVGGNAYDVNQLKFNCSVCGAPANVSTAQEVGLDRSDPAFEKKLEELTADFSSLSYYLVTVKEGQMRMEVRPRTQITIGFAVYCKTCKASIPVTDKIRETLKQQHGDHDVLISPVSDNPLSPQLMKMFRESMEQMLGEKLPYKEES